MNVTTTKEPCKICKGSGFVRFGWRGRHRRCKCTPAPGLGPNAAEHVGECGVCGRMDLAIDRKKHALSLHGYERPGDGWINGRCPGARMQPVELSPETIVLVRDWSRQRGDLMDTSIADMHAGTIKHLHVELRRHNAYSSRLTHAEKYEEFIVRPGDPERVPESDVELPRFTQRKIPSWEELKSKRLAEWEQERDRSRTRQARAEKRIAEWTPQPLRLRDPLAAAVEATKTRGGQARHEQHAAELDKIAAVSSTPVAVERDHPDAECSVCGKMYFSADGAPTLAICGGCWKKGRR